MNWKFNVVKEMKLKDPVLVEGLPGIGNVGKVAVDFIIDELGAKKIASFESYGVPHSVFVNEKNLVELPSIELFVKQRRNGRDLLFLSGDVQPVDELSCYHFVDKVLECCSQFGCREIVTLGGVALKQIPKSPQVYCTGNESKIVKAYHKGTEMNANLYGRVGPIIGVSGVLLGMAKRKSIKGVSLLAETYGHPFYIGVSGARELIRVLNNKLSLKLNLTQLDKDVEHLEHELAQNPKLARRLSKLKKGPEDINYIG